MDNSKWARSEKSRRLPRDRAYVEPGNLQSARNGYGRLPAGMRIPNSVCASTPEVGAQCGSSARWDLRGGRPVRAVPTATLGMAMYSKNMM